MNWGRLFSRKSNQNGRITDKEVEEALRWAIAQGQKNYQREECERPVASYLRHAIAYIRGQAEDKVTENVVDTVLFSMSAAYEENGRRHDPEKYASAIMDALTQKAPSVASQLTPDELKKALEKAQSQEISR